MYEEFINQLYIYANMIRILSKGYLPISLLPPSKLQDILGKVKKAIELWIKIMIWLSKDFIYIMIWN